MSARIKDVWVPLPATNWNPRDAADEAIGEDGDLLLSDGPLQMRSPKWLHTDSNGHDVHWIAQLRHRDGRPFWAEAHLPPVYGAGGKTTHFIIVLNDVTERETAAAETATA